MGDLSTGAIVAIVLLVPIGVATLFLAAWCCGCCIPCGFYPPKNRKSVKTQKKTIARGGIPSGSKGRKSLQPSQNSETAPLLNRNDTLDIIFPPPGAVVIDANANRTRLSKDSTLHPNDTDAIRRGSAAAAVDQMSSRWNQRRASLTPARSPSVSSEEISPENTPARVTNVWGSGLVLSKN